MPFACPGCVAKSKGAINRPSAFWEAIGELFIVRVTALNVRCDDMKLEELLVSRSGLRVRKVRLCRLDELSKPNAIKLELFKIWGFKIDVPVSTADPEFFSSNSRVGASSPTKLAVEVLEANSVNNGVKELPLAIPPTFDDWVISPILGLPVVVRDPNS